MLFSNQRPYINDPSDELIKVAAFNDFSWEEKVSLKWCDDSGVFGYSYGCKTIFDLEETVNYGKITALTYNKRVSIAQLHAS